MFSGLTNQVSNWMGKKGEDGSDLPPDEKVASPGPVDPELDLEKKDTRYNHRSFYDLTPPLPLFSSSFPTLNFHFFVNFKNFFFLEFQNKDNIDIVNNNVSLKEKNEISKLSLTGDLDKKNKIKQSVFQNGGEGKNGFFVLVVPAMFLQKKEFLKKTRVGIDSSQSGINWQSEGRADHVSFIDS